MSNDQIHNNLCLTVENSIEIGKGYQVIEKWVFFKLFQILQTDSSGGKNHTQKESTKSFVAQILFRIINHTLKLENIFNNILKDRHVILTPR